LDFQSYAWWSRCCHYFERPSDGYHIQNVSLVPEESATGIVPYIIFMLMWLGWEHIYYDVQVSWPWLTLGNALATSVKSAQWYAMTGTIGGSFWILLMNILFLRIIKFIAWKEEILQSSIVAAIFLFVPLIYSHFRYYTYDENSGFGVTKEISILQPNIDPYNDKFGGLSNSQQDSILFNLAKQAVTSKHIWFLRRRHFSLPTQRQTYFWKILPTAIKRIRLSKIFHSHTMLILFGEPLHNFSMRLIIRAECLK
jgi:hypothetical protein